MAAILVRSAARTAAPHRHGLDTGASATGPRWTRERSDAIRTSARYGRHAGNPRRVAGGDRERGDRAQRSPRGAQGPPVALRLSFAAVRSRPALPADGAGQAA